MPKAGHRKLPSIATRPLLLPEETIVFTSNDPVILELSLKNNPTPDSSPEWKRDGVLFLVFDADSTFSRVVFLQTNSGEDKPTELDQHRKPQKGEYSEADSSETTPIPDPSEDNTTDDNGTDDDIDSDDESSADSSDDYDRDLIREEIGFITHFLLTEQMDTISKLQNHQTLLPSNSLSVSYHPSINIGDPSLPQPRDTLRCKFRFCTTSDRDDFLNAVAKAKQLFRIPRVSLKEIVDAGTLIQPGDLLKLEYRKQHWKGRITQQGHIVDIKSNREFRSLSGFSREMKHSVNPTLTSDNGWRSLSLIWTSVRDRLFTRQDEKRDTKEDVDPDSDDEDSWGISTRESDESEDEPQPMYHIREQHCASQRLCELLKSMIRVGVYQQPWHRKPASTNENRHHREQHSDHKEEFVRKWADDVHSKHDK